MNYIERYWRDAKPEDAIKDPPMVARFRDKETSNWGGPRSLTGWDRTGDLLWSNGSCFWKYCQVYDAPDPGEGWRLIDVEKEAKQEGDQFLDRQGTWRMADSAPFCHRYIYRRHIAPAVTYVPFTWEDREELRGRWVRAIDISDNEWMITSLYLGESGDLRANGVGAGKFLSGFVFVDTGEPVGKKVM